MSSVVKTVSKVMDPGGLVQKTVGDPLGVNWTDPLNIGADATTPDVPTTEDLSGFETEDQTAEEVIAGEAEDVATEAKRKKKETTSTILTSPLGATTTAKTAVAKLGGY